MASQDNNSDYETYYVPESSKLAICASVSAAVIVLGVAGGINESSGHFAPTGEGNPWFMFFVGMIMLTITMFAWFKTAIEDNLNGLNSEQLKISYRMGMQWFIFSEVMFFFCFFGTLFYIRTFAAPWLAGSTEESAMNSILWPNFSYEWPLMITPQDAVGGVDGQAAAGHLANNGVMSGPDRNMSFWTADVWYKWLPLWNTLLLVTSSVFCEFAHHALKAGHRKKFNVWLGLTLLLGFIFVGLQALEYYEAYYHYGLTLQSGAYGATFFMLTGFHGFHVCLGAVMLSVQWLRSMTKGHFTAEDHFGFEASAWYWHFVDVVWIFLVLVVYLY